MIPPIKSDRLRSVAQASHLQGRKRPGTMRGSRLPMKPGWLGCAAFTRIELLTVLAALGLLLAVAWPGLAKSREPGRRVACANNLRQITRGWLMWAGEHGGITPPLINSVDGGSKSNQNAYAHFLAAAEEIATPTILVCPSEPIKRIATTWAEFDSPPSRNNAVSYFVGLDVGAYEWTLLMTGDPHLLGLQDTVCGFVQVRARAVNRNDTRVSWSTTSYHAGSGNFAFSDGSVVQTGADVRRWVPRVFTDTAAEHILVSPQSAYP